MSGRRFQRRGVRNSRRVNVDLVSSRCIFIRIELIEKASIAMPLVVHIDDIIAI